MASARATEVGRRLMDIPGVGPLLASALVAIIPDPHAFRSGRIWQPGSVSCRSRTPVAARSGWAGSRGRRSLLKRGTGKKTGLLVQVGRVCSLESDGTAGREIQSVGASRQAASPQDYVYGIAVALEVHFDGLHALVSTHSMKQRPRKVAM